MTELTVHLVALAFRQCQPVQVAGSVVAELKSLFFQGEETSEGGTDLAPADPSHFGATVQAFIGESSSDLFDSFDVLVCSPSWMMAATERGEWTRFQNAGLRVLPASIAVGAGIWFMRRWDTADFRAAVLAVCESASPGPDWGTVAARIGRLIPWEYDYRYDAHVNGNYGEAFPPSPSSQ